MDEIAQTELGGQAMEIVAAAETLDRETGIARLQSLLGQALTEQERDEIRWAIDGFLVASPPTAEEIREIEATLGGN